MKVFLKQNFVVDFRVVSPYNVTNW